jgi:hypothetical protein
VNGVIRRIDDLQRRWRVTSFLWSVQKKYSDDRGGYLAALVTYYGFLSIFPLLLAAFTVIAYVLSGDKSAAASLQSHIRDYPIIDKIAPGLSKGTLHGSPVALIVGLLGLIWGSQGLAQAAQFTMDEAWNIPNKTRPGFVSRTIRSFGWYGLFGVASWWPRPCRRSARPCTGPAGTCSPPRPPSWWMPGCSCFRSGSCHHPASRSGTSCREPWRPARRGPC